MVTYSHRDSTRGNLPSCHVSCNTISATLFRLHQVLHFLHYHYSHQTNQPSDLPPSPAPPRERQGHCWPRGFCHISPLFIPPPIIGTTPHHISPRQPPPSPPAKISRLIFRQCHYLFFTVMARASWHHENARWHKVHLHDTIFHTGNQ